MSYPKEFRDQVFKIKEKEGLTNLQVAKRFGVSERVIYKWKHQKAPRQRRNKPATKINMEALKQDVADRPGAYLEERAKTFNVSVSCIFYALRRLNIRYKKKH